jgi:drug/metabolite transporter (DMT)-like permease
VILLLVAVGRTDDLGRLTTVSWVELVWLGAVSSAFMYSAIAQAMRVFTATTAVTLLTVATPLSVAVAWLVLGERPTAAATLGGLVVIAGVLLTIRDT